MAKLVVGDKCNKLGWDDRFPVIRKLYIHNYVIVTKLGIPFFRSLYTYFSKTIIKHKQV